MPHPVMYLAGVYYAKNIIILKMVACGALMIQSYLVTEDDNKKLNANYYYYYYYY